MARSIATARDIARGCAGWSNARASRCGRDWSSDVCSSDLDKELIVGTRYWEGAVAVSGSAAARPVAGQGYVELVGYAE